MKTVLNTGNSEYILDFPEQTRILSMKGACAVSDPSAAIADALDNPIGTEGFDRLIYEKLRSSPNADAVIVISDNTRPVPYKGPRGILLPLVDRLIDAGIPPHRITVLCANGTHKPLSPGVFRALIDPAVFDRGVRVVNHDCLAEAELKSLGCTSRGTEIKINRLYADADIRILTGLVESHFMAGFSGGRKSICPGLIGEGSTFIFHGPEFLEDPRARDLNLDGNPCHEEALEIARTVPADFIINVTLNQDFNVTGYFAGDMEKAHLAACEKVRDSVVIEESGTFDIVVTHAGFVGRNHYQAAKAAAAALSLLGQDSFLIMAADCTDSDPVGRDTYRKVLPFLKSETSGDFLNRIKSPGWDFVPDQWQVQMWAKLFNVIDQEQFIFYAPQIAEEDYSLLPGEDGNRYLPPEKRYQQKEGGDIAGFIRSALSDIIKQLEARGRTEPGIAWLPDGPYGIVVKT